MTRRLAALVAALAVTAPACAKTGPTTLVVVASEGRSQPDWITAVAGCFGLSSQYRVRFIDTSSLPTEARVVVAHDLYRAKGPEIQACLRALPGITKVVEPL